MSIQRVIIRGSAAQQDQIFARLCDVAATCSVRVHRGHITGEATEVLCQGHNEDLDLLRSLAEGRSLEAPVLQGRVTTMSMPLSMAMPEGGATTRRSVAALVFTDSLEPLEWELANIPEAGARKRRSPSRRRRTLPEVEGAIQAKPAEPLVPEQEGGSGMPGAPDDDDMLGGFIDDDPLTL